MSDKQLVQKQFGKNAAAYVTSRVHAKGASLQRLVELVQPQSNWQALDIATATGHTAFTFAPHVAHVFATDITNEMLKVAAGVAEEKGITNVSFKYADAEQLPFEDDTFDLVTSRIAPHHFPHIDRFIAESVRVLNPNGILAVVDNVVPGSRLRGKKADKIRKAGEYVNAFEKLRDPSHGRALSLEEWVDGFQDAGLNITHQETMQKRMEFYRWAVRLGADEVTVARLRVMLLQAPDPVLKFLTPQVAGDRIDFYLTEAIVIGRLETS